ncbi:MAG: 16S rRNA (guanine(527)-N(7))-methyltransferase RsmG [Planctomycetota bacterium]
MSANADAEFDKQLTTSLHELGVNVNEDQCARLRAHWRFMCEVNRQTNLTRITQPRDAAVKHVADSLALVSWGGVEALESCNLLDLGTGAGFPAIPLAIVKPGWRVTALDSRGRKIEFVSACARRLKLTNLEAVHAHSDHWQADRVYSIVTARALAAPGRAIGFAEPHLALDGQMVIYVVDDGTPGLEGAGRAVLEERGLVMADSFSYSLTLAGEVLKRRLLVVARKR